MTSFNTKITILQDGCQIIINSYASEKITATYFNRIISKLSSSSFLCHIQQTDSRTLILSKINLKTNKVIIGKQPEEDIEYLNKECIWSAKYNNFPILIENDKRITCETLKISLWNRITKRDWIVRK
jgi:hypothetical protein